MLATSAIQVIHQAPARLIVVDPPYYGLGGVFAVGGLLWIIGTLVMVLRSHASMRYGAILVLMGAPFLILGLIFLTSQTRSTLSRDTNSMTVERDCLGIRLQHREVQLGAVREAVVEGGRGHTLIVLVDSGAPITLAGRTDRDGYYEAAKAINDFIQRPRTR